MAFPRFPLVVGLGNPGSDYRGTRHNFGFEVLDLLAEEENLQWKKARFARAWTCRTAEGWWLVKPTTFMNRSGDAVRDSLDWFRFSTGALLVVLDDIHLDPGRLRLRPGGSHGGHNGLKSIEQAIQTAQYARLRGGVGKPDGTRPLEHHVLSAFSEPEREAMNRSRKTAADAVRQCQTTDLELVMNSVNGRQ